MSHKDLPTHILQNFTRLFTDAKAYPYKCATIIINDPKGNGHKSYTSSKTLASALNDDYKNNRKDGGLMHAITINDMLVGDLVTTRLFTNPYTATVERVSPSTFRISYERSCPSVIKGDPPVVRTITETKTLDPIAIALINHEQRTMGDPDNYFYLETNNKNNKRGADMAKKYYAIRKPKNIRGIYTDWPRVQSLLKGVSGPEYKGFKTKEDAQGFLDEKLVRKKAHYYRRMINGYELKGNVVDVGSNDPLLRPYSGARYATDGSFHEATKTYGAGCVHLDANGQIIERFKRAENNEAYVSSRNIAGEVLAFGLAVMDAVNANRKKITIIHDYKGIGLWGDETYSTQKSAIARRFANMLEYAVENGITTIDYIRVNGHEGIPCNEAADKLAGQAARGI